MTDDELRELIAAIDANVRELMADGKLAAAKYTAGDGGVSTDRAAGLKALLEARSHYQKLLDARLAAAAAASTDPPAEPATDDKPVPDGWEVSRYVPR